MQRTFRACAAALSLAACAPTMTRHLPAQDDPSNPDAPESPPSRAPAPESHAASYTCPMHPEVISDRPGHCPKCGMALVPRAAP